MRRLAALAAGVSLALAAAWVPAIGQDHPESILPPGFGEPAARPSAAPAAGSTPASPGATIEALPSGLPTVSPSDTPTATPTPDAHMLAEYALPSFARRSLARVGSIGTGDGGLPSDAFGAADGPYLERLMRTLDVPLPSRWMSILLRRALVSAVDTPQGANGADFAAERAWLLLRMGESLSARAVVQDVDTSNYTPKLYQVAMNTALATGDPAQLCPLVDGGVRETGEAGWTLAKAMCVGLSGEAARAGTLVTQAKRHNVARGVDLLLAQKVVGTGAQGRQAVTIEWTGVDRLTAWRFGLATATGVAVPEELYAGAGRQLNYWRALAPAIPLAARVAPAEAAAGQGVLSNAALVDLYSAVDAADDSAAAPAATAQDLKTAYTGTTVDARMAAMRQLWGATGAKPAYARLVLTARAAAQIPVASGSGDAPALVASMLSAGLDRTAMRWRGSVDKGGDAWAMIVLADPDSTGSIGYGDLAGYSGSGDAGLKLRLLFAGLAGLGRLAPGDIERAAEKLNVRIGAENAWTRALDRAARAGQPGTVVLLAAVGMQTPSWHGVPPEALYRIVGALRSVGLEGDARMIAAEAIARL
ncbi:hypothetical protein [uncultured Sphingomonas sp.]|uniref:hypothetical protein n=1 Tax=uncultured Sphingomonas sp. TaxID=158754 RepID=UPI0035CC3A73